MTAYFLKNFSSEEGRSSRQCVNDGHTYISIHFHIHGHQCFILHCSNVPILSLNHCGRNHKQSGSVVRSRRSLTSALLIPLLSLWMYTRSSTGTPSGLSSMPFASEPLIPPTVEKSCCYNFFFFIIHPSATNCNGCCKINRNVFQILRNRSLDC